MIIVSLGREKEKEIFRKLLREIRAEDSHLDSKGKFVLIIGDTGIGKTRVMEEFMDIAENDEFRSVLRFRIVRELP